MSALKHNLMLSGTGLQRAFVRFQPAPATHVCGRCVPANEAREVRTSGGGRIAPANSSFQRTPLRGFARVSIHAFIAVRPRAGAAQLAPR